MKYERNLIGLKSPDFKTAQFLNLPEIIISTANQFVVDKRNSSIKHGRTKTYQHRQSDEEMQLKGSSVSFFQKMQLAKRDDTSHEESVMYSNPLQLKINSNQAMQFWPQIRSYNQSNNAGEDTPRQNGRVNVSYLDTLHSSNQKAAIQQ